jgi:hypothetical protein
MRITTVASVDRSVKPESRITRAVTMRRSLSFTSTLAMRRTLLASLSSVVQSEARLAASVTAIEALDFAPALAFPVACLTEWPSVIRIQDESLLATCVTGIRTVHLTATC